MLFTWSLLNTWTITAQAKFPPRHCTLEKWTTTKIRWRVCVVCGRCTFGILLSKTRNIWSEWLSMQFIFLPVELPITTSAYAWKPTDVDDLASLALTPWRYTILFLVGLSPAASICHTFFLTTSKKSKLSKRFQEGNQRSRKHKKQIQWKPRSVQESGEASVARNS